MIFNHKHSSDGTMLRRASLILVVVCCLLTVSNSTAGIDKHCLHGQSFNLLTDGTIVKVSNYIYILYVYSKY